LIGNSWWSDVVRRGDESKHSPPRVIVSISGEAAGQEGNIEWSAALGKPFDVSDPPTGTTYIGRCVGKQLFISDVDEKKKKVEALVKVIGPTGEDEPERVIGVFPSRPIKVISKPSKKRQSAKNLERMSSTSPRDPVPNGIAAQCVLITGPQFPSFIVYDLKLYRPSTFVSLVPVLRSKDQMVPH
jgi:hypothetical protein